MYNKILVPMDGSVFSECVLSHVRTVAKGCKAGEVTILFVVDPPGPSGSSLYRMPAKLMEEIHHNALAAAEEYVSGVASKLNAEGIPTITAVESGYPAETILSYASGHKVDLIIMSSHGRTGVSRWVMGSVADKVVRYSPIPILLVTPPECKLSERK
jgi:nucleotide-binding universal stress UspA family protein